MFTHQHHRSGSRRQLFGGHEYVVRRDPRGRLRRQLTSNTSKRPGSGSKRPPPLIPSDQDGGWRDTVSFLSPCFVAGDRKPAENDFSQSQEAGRGLWTVTDVDIVSGEGRQVIAGAARGTGCHLRRISDEESQLWSSGSGTKTVFCGQGQGWGRDPGLCHVAQDLKTYRLSRDMVCHFLGSECVGAGPRRQATPTSTNRDHC